MDDAHVSDIVAGQIVEADLQIIHVVVQVVVFQDAIGDGAFFGFFFRDLAAQLLFDGSDFLFRNHFGAVEQVAPVLVQFDHDVPSLFHK